MKEFIPTEWNVAQQREAVDLDSRLLADHFSDDVRQSVYRFALIRNSWGTTNIDAGPISVERVEELYEAFRAGVNRAGNIIPGEREVLNYFELVDDLPTEPFEVSAEDLRQLHAEYFRGVPLQNDARPGVWKTANNVVPGPYGVLKTTAKEDVQRDLDALLAWLNGDARGLPTLVRGALFFHEFQRIHPFGDGNGRSGRLATQLVLSIGGLPNIRFAPVDDGINEDRKEYYASLAGADAGNPEPWVNFFSAAVVNGYQRANLLARRLQKIPPRVPVGVRRLLEWLYIHQISQFRPADAQRFFLTESRFTIRRRLEELEALGLVKGAGRGRGRQYKVVPLLEVENATSPQDAPALPGKKKARR